MSIGRHSVLVVALAMVLTGCGTAPNPTDQQAPAPTPATGDLGALQAALALRGVTVHSAVSGDAGCPGQEGLHDNAARFSLTLAGEDQSYEVFVLRWRRPSDFDAAAGPFGACVDEYARQVQGDVALEVLEVPPYRAYGPGWSEELITVLRDALTAVAGT